MKKTLTIVGLTLLIASPAWADDPAAKDAPSSSQIAPKGGGEARSTTKTTARNDRAKVEPTSAVDAARKRSEQPLVDLRKLSAPEVAPIAGEAVGPTMAEGRLSSLVGSTSAEVNASMAGRQKEIAAPRAVVAKSASTPTPAVERAIAALRPKFRQCASKPVGAVVMTVAIDAAGQIDAQLASGIIDAATLSCVAGAIKSARIRGGRGTTSAVQIPF